LSIVKWFETIGFERSILTFMPIKTLLPQKERKTVDFDSIRLKVASPEVILEWSHGEVSKPETINYRTQKPEKDGLFDERIFGPTKDFECYCGKYKRIRYRGIVCEKCGVQVTRSIVRRERMGHIGLAAPVSHIWFLRGVPSKLGLLLDLSVQELEKVIYFANYIICEVNEELRASALEQVNNEFKQKNKQIESEFNQKISNIKNNQELSKEQREEQLKTLQKMKQQELEELDEIKNLAIKELSELKIRQVIAESVYMDLSLKYGQVFEASIGAEAIRQLLDGINLETLAKDLENQAKETSKSQSKRVNKRLKLVKNLIKNNIRPEWMILTSLPVIPPDLRPMVALDGGRFAASDLNDLYRRVINRNNRLKRLLELNAPEVIVRNEKRMLQEAVDALIDNQARHGKTVTASTGQKRMLKSLADALKGKQGRFRQNLLGKRTDYSGRSVIVVGPHLRLDQCGLPKTMALELFRPFIIAQLVKREIVHNIRSANRFIEQGSGEVWDILEEIIQSAHVLLNRAPTLHRLGIQAFKPILIEGKAIQVHPLVCPAFNADFDGDQMAVHVPLTKAAKREAREIMLSAVNLLKPGDGSPIVTPHQDIIWGLYYLTYVPVDAEQDEQKMKSYSSLEEAEIAYENNLIKLQQPIRVMYKKELIVITVGRLIFNSVLPAKLGLINKTMNSSTLSELVAHVFSGFDNLKSAEFVDKLKELSLKYLTVSGLSWTMSDLPDLPKKAPILAEAENKVKEIRGQYEAGLLTNDERHARVIEVWAEVKDKVVDIAKESLDKKSSIYTIIDSKARGSWAQMTQMIGIKGNVVNPAGELIELPVKASFKEGMDVLEYFISTHGARKGLSDTALRTANAGYLTRRLIDVSQDIVVTEEDCGDETGFVLTASESQEMNLTLASRLRGRVAAEAIKHPKSGKVIVEAGELVDDKKAQKIEPLNIEQARIRSVVTCQLTRGLCQACYGWDLGYNQPVKPGTAVGIIAAQSIGEPGTQLTMRTFHTGGVAGADITQGLPRVEELFETRPVKKSALMAPFAGQVTVEDVPGTRQKLIKLRGQEIREEKLEISQSDLDKLQVKDGQKVKKGQVLLTNKGGELTAPIQGVLQIEETAKSVKSIILKIVTEKESEKELSVPTGFGIWVKTGDLVNQGDQLTEGSLDLHELYNLKGIDVVRKYILKEILYIYTSQGQKLNEKHVNIIIRQLFSRVLISEPGETDYLIGEVSEYTKVLATNLAATKAKQKPAQFHRLLLGITKVSLSTESWLSAASFQETARVLIDAATTGKVDYLRGLKENVIIGRLIPAGTGYKGGKK